MLALAAIGTLVYGERERIRYAFLNTDTPALAVGDVAASHPAKLPHNAFVAIEGVTELRGLTQSAVRLPNLRKQQLVYFRLSGSQGVFIEVPADDRRFGPAVSVSVVGRAVDPWSDGRLSGVMRDFERVFHKELGASLRVVQVDEHPASGRLVFGGLLVVFGLVLGSNAWIAVRAIRRYRR